MKKFTISAVAMTVAMTAGAAFAHDHWEDKFKKMDSNDDGMISMQEFNAQTQEKFVKMDTNGDNMVSMDEMKAHKEKYKEEKKDK